jgi:hypothetical protein
MTDTISESKRTAKYRDPKVRLAKGKARTHEAMRAKLSFGGALRRIEECETKLAEMLMVRVIEDEETGEKTYLQPRPDSAAVSALKVIMDSNWRKIGKLLPDLKATDITTNGESLNDPGAGQHLMDVVEIRKRLAYQLQRAGVTVIDGDSEEVQDTIIDDEEDIPSFLR